MDHRYSLKNKVVRAGFYVTSIGGLMMLFAGLLWVCWNHLVVNHLEYAPLSFLEAVGLVSIAYIVYSSLRFSSQSEACAEAQEIMYQHHAEHNSSQTHPMGASSSSQGGLLRGNLIQNGSNAVSTLNSSATVRTPAPTSAHTTSTTTSSDSQTQVQSAAMQGSGDITNTTSIPGLNGEQKEQLKREIERCCGKSSLDALARSGVGDGPVS